MKDEDILASPSVIRPREQMTTNSRLRNSASVPLRPTPLATIGRGSLQPTNKHQLLEQSLTKGVASTRKSSSNNSSRPKHQQDPAASVSEAVANSRASNFSKVRK